MVIKQASTALLRLRTPIIQIQICVRLRIYSKSLYIYINTARAVRRRRDLPVCRPILQEYVAGTQVLGTQVQVPTNHKLGPTIPYIYLTRYSIGSLKVRLYV